MEQINWYSNYDTYLTGSPQQSYFISSLNSQKNKFLRPTHFVKEFIASNSINPVLNLNANLNELLKSWTLIEQIVITINTSNASSIKKIDIDIDQARFTYSPVQIKILELIKGKKYMYATDKSIVITIPLEIDFIPLIPDIPVNLSVELSDPAIIRADFKVYKLDRVETSNLFEQEIYNVPIGLLSYSLIPADHVGMSNFGIKEMWFNIPNSDFKNLEICLSKKSDPSQSITKSWDLHQLLCTNYLLEGKQPIEGFGWLPFGRVDTPVLAGGINTLDYKLDILTSGLGTILILEPKILLFKKSSCVLTNQMVFSTISNK
jgi:hypothetical protein